MLIKGIKPEFTNEIYTEDWLFLCLNIWLLRNVGEAEVKLRLFLDLLLEESCQILLLQASLYIKVLLIYRTLYYCPHLYMYIIQSHSSY
jgi:hypothetical protein